jgi:OmpA-OmpF porin, OOP family
MSSATDPHAHHAVPHAAAPSSGPDLRPGAAAVALLLGLVLTAVTLWVLLAPRLYYTPAPPPAAAAAGEEAQAAPEPAAAAAGEAQDLGAMVERELTGGAKVSVPERGVEGRLLAFIADAGRPADKTTWFDFDRLTFETGKATLGAASGDQLAAVAAILAAYPAVKLKIGGYTDNVGDPAFNQKLSERRAASVAAALAGLGVGQDRLAAEGYGDQFPVADNATAEGRARNRRISMRVTEK